MTTNTNKFNLLEICDQYCRENTIRPQTISSYKRIVRILLRDTGISFPDEVTHEVLFEWRDSVIGRGCTTTTWNTYHRHIRAVLNYCVRMKLLQENPIVHVKQYRRRNSRGKACSQQDLKKLCQHLQEDTDDPLAVFTLRSLLTLYYTGVRCTQLCGLEWRDISFRKKTIFLHEQYSKTGEKYSIPLHEDLHDILLEMKRDASIRFLDFGPASQVFHLQAYGVSRRYVGNRMTPEQYARVLKRAAQKCRVRVTAHSIRHLFATLLANQEANPKTGELPLTLVAVKDLLGHRNISTTVGYIEPSLETQREVLRGLKSLTSTSSAVSRSSSGVLRVRFPKSA